MGITDKWLSNFLHENYPENTHKKLAREVVKLRQQNAELIADGERLAKFVSDTAAHDWREVITMTYQGHLELVSILDQHNELMERIGGGAKT